jgi:hypothetical protein
VVVDRDVQVVVADPATVHGSAADVFAAAVPPPPAAVGHLAEFLDVDVEQVTGACSFVADPGVPVSDRGAGDRVDRRQRRDLVSGQDASDGGGDQAESGGEEQRPAPDFGAQGEDLGLELGGDLGGARVRARRAIGQAVGAFGEIAADPLVDRGAGDTELFSDSWGGPAAQVALDHELAAVDGGAGVSVGHEDLRCAGWLRQTHPLRPEVLPRSSRHAVNNVLGHDT